MEAKNINKENTNQEGWNVNTAFGCELKTYLCSDKVMKTNKVYRGILRLDRDAIVDEFLFRDAHYTFMEDTRRVPVKRNPHVFNGRYITVTRKDDGTLRLNFKHFNMGAGFNIERYALWVHNEICMALRGLVEER